jgi:Inovirus Coat protein B
MKRLQKMGLAAAGLAAAGAASAAPTVTDVVAEIVATGIPVAQVGSAILILMIAIKAFVWIRKALG